MGWGKTQIKPVEIRGIMGEIQTLPPMMATQKRRLMLNQTAISKYRVNQGLGQKAIILPSTVMATSL